MIYHVPSAAGADSVRLEALSKICYRLADALQTATTLRCFVLAMILYPNVMRKAQDELDTVVGRDRAPAFDDIPELTYIQAVLRELLRWKPVIPLGLFLDALAHFIS